MSDVSTKEKVLENIDNKGMGSVNMKEYSEVKEKYEQKLKNYNKKTEQECQLETKLQRIVKEEEDLVEKVSCLNNELSFQKDFKLSFVGGKEFK